ncbi:hypothetical protein BAE44_0022377 [Dichanthelium oligosanthes]|uniref:F-box domain-containing protein n=1 Tax=Dichanthelium oligosanthes TaxID=888268 RepID=A0A1E5UUW8_9POAL|nr:hypothetical protein BAE44_0022377 [Dichanthelium oligosanthes]
MSALPDHLLDHIPGFLPVEQAVQTSILARRWCHLWSTMCCLHFISSKGKLGSAFDFNMLVYCMRLHREHSLALDDEVEFTGTGYRFWHDNDIDFNNWIQHALLCQVSVLSVRLLIG